MRALAQAFADTLEMVADGALPDDLGMEFVAVMESRLAGLGYRIVSDTLLTHARQVTREATLNVSQESITWAELNTLATMLESVEPH